eukprot:TRINITY_DN3900_c0_g1_i1.p1 TRINITY_DN3900_c0_g1~~TRINITY_DN3900_c0_g1_i1.p1  ORF type:complete len:505 (+),score=98.54 TRINITY_DN3900_c0_g1_i1:52-1566(+)
MAARSDVDRERSSAKSVAVVGAGISGLAAAYRLKSQGFAVTVFETEGCIGGKIQSISQDGFTWEKGANTMTESEPEVRRLIDDLGIREKQQFPISQNKRYIVRDGVPHLIPSSPISLIGSKFLSTQAKLSLFLEPLLWKPSHEEGKVDNFSGKQLDESVGSFFRRHFGQEVTDYMVDPFVAGTSGGDPETLSVHHAFKEVWDLEERFGSIIIGLLWSNLSKRKSQKDFRTDNQRQRRYRGSFSFKGGLQTLTDALSSKIGEDSLSLQSSVLSLSWNLQGTSDCKSWSVFYKKWNDKHKEIVRKQSFDAVIITTPLNRFKEMQLSKNGVPFSLDFLPKVSYLPVSVVITTFAKEDVKQPLEGFGILVPSKEQKNGFQTLGTLFSSSMFPERAPANRYIFTTFIGGSRNMKLANKPLRTLQEIAVNDLQRLVGVKCEPLSVKHFYWKEAFPLYSLDYQSVINAMNDIEASFPGLYLAGNHRDGLSVGKALVSGLKAADRVISNILF